MNVNDKPVTDADVDEAVARAFGRETGHTVDGLDATIAEAFGRRPRAMSADDAAVEVAVARAFGREPDPRAVEAVRRAASAEAAARESAPWRAACPWDTRDALRDAEEHLVRLYSSRRGESLESAQRTAERALREAWEHPGGLSLTSDRWASVVAALDEHTRRLEALPPISSTTEAGRRPGRMINVVKEVRS